MPPSGVQFPAAPCVGQPRWCLKRKCGRGIPSSPLMWASGAMYLVSFPRSRLWGCYLSCLGDWPRNGQRTGTLCKLSVSAKVRYGVVTGITGYGTCSGIQGRNLGSAKGSTYTKATGYLKHEQYYKHHQGTFGDTDTTQSPRTTGSRGMLQRLESKHPPTVQKDQTKFDMLCSHKVLCVQLSPWFVTGIPLPSFVMHPSHMVLMAGLKSRT
jgi:hypothetical protein